MSALQNEKLPLSSSLTDCFVPKKNEKLDNVISKLKGRIGIVNYKNVMENNSANTLYKKPGEKEQMSDEIHIEKCNTVNMFLPKSVDEHSIFTKSYLMWENNSNICWLDASMSLLVHNHTLQQVLADTPQTQMGKIMKHHNDAMSVLNDYTSPDNSDIRLSKAKELLKTAQDSTLKYLQPFLKCIDGQPDSAFCSLFNLISKEKSIKHLFDIEYSWIRSCKKCHVHRTKKDKKVVITLPHVKAFQPNSPITVCQCPACKESDQNIVLVYKSLPQCLLFHFENGAGKGELQSLDFEVENRRYKITGIMTLEKGTESDVNHFVTWIRDPDTEGWLECNDLNLDITSFSVISPCINLEEVYILMYEAWGEFSNVPLVLKSSNSDVEESTILDIPLIDIAEEECQEDIINQKGGCNKFKNSRLALTATDPTTEKIEGEEINFSSKCQLDESILLLSREACSPERVRIGKLMLSSEEVLNADTTVDVLASLLSHSKPPGESQFSKSSVSSCTNEKGIVYKKSIKDNKEPKLTCGAFEIFKKSSACTKDFMNSQKNRDGSNDNKNNSIQIKSIEKYFEKKSVTLKQVQSEEVEKLQEASSETVKKTLNSCYIENSNILQNFSEMKVVAQVAKKANETLASKRKKLEKNKVPLFIEKVGERKTVTSSLEDSSNNISEHQVALKEETILDKASVSENSKLSSDNEKTYFQDESSNSWSEFSTKKMYADSFSADLKKTKTPEGSGNHSYFVNIFPNESNSSLLLVPEPKNSKKSESNQISVEQKKCNQTSDEQMKLRDIAVKTNEPVSVKLIEDSTLRMGNVQIKMCKEYVTNKDSQIKSISPSLKSKYLEKVVVCKDKSENVNSPSDTTDTSLLSEYSPHLEELKRKNTFLGHTQLLQSRGIVVQQVLAENTLAKPNNIRGSSEVSSTSMLEASSKDNSNITTHVKRTSPLKRVTRNLDQDKLTPPKKMAKLLSTASPNEGNGNTVDQSVVLPSEKHSSGTSMKKVCVLLQRFEDSEILQMQANGTQNKAVPHFQKDMTVFKEDQHKDVLKMEVKTKEKIPSVAILKDPNIKNKELLMLDSFKNPSQGLFEKMQMKIENEISVESPFCKVSKVISPSSFGNNENAREPGLKPSKSIKNIIGCGGVKQQTGTMSESLRKGGKLTHNSKLKRSAKCKYSQSALQEVYPLNTKFSTEDHSITQCVSKINLNASIVEDSNCIVNELTGVLGTNSSIESCHPNLQKNAQDIPSEIGDFSPYPLNNEFHQVIHPKITEDTQMISNNIKREKICLEVGNCNKQLIEETAKGTSKCQRPKRRPASKKLINLPLIAHNNNNFNKTQENGSVVCNTENGKNETGKRSRKPSKKLIEAQMHFAVFNADKRHSGEKSLVKSDILNTETTLKTYSRKRKQDQANVTKHSQLDVSKGGKKNMLSEQDNLILNDATKPKQQSNLIDLPIPFHSAVLLQQQSSPESGRKCKQGTFNLNSDYAKTQTDNIPELALKCSNICPCHKEDVYTQIDVIVDYVVSSMFDFFGISSRV